MRKTNNTCNIKPYHIDKLTHPIFLVKQTDNGFIGKRLGEEQTGMTRGRAVGALHQPQVVGNKVRQDSLRQETQPLCGIFKVGDIVEAK